MTLTMCQCCLRCDLCRPTARKWATEALKLPIPSSTGSNGAAAGPTAAQLFSLSAEAAAASPRATAPQINDRLRQHTQHCVVCQQAMRELQLKLKIAQAAAAAMAAGLIGLIAAVVLPALVPMAAAAAAAAGTGSGVAWGPVAAVAAVLGAGAAAAAAVGRSTAKVLEQFVYVEFSHATNH